MDVQLLDYKERRMSTQIPRRTALRRLAIGTVAGLTGLGSVSTATTAGPDDDEDDGDEPDYCPNALISILIPRFTTVVFQYPQEDGPTVTVEVRESDEIVDELTLEPGANYITGYDEGEYEAEAWIAGTDGRKPVEVEGSPFDTAEREPPSS